MMGIDNTPIVLIDDDQPAPDWSDYAEPQATFRDIYLHAVLFIAAIAVVVLVATWGRA
jgi:hypothetical protein